MSSRVVAAAARRLGKRPRLATLVLRLPRLAPRRLRAALFRSFSWPLAKRLGAEADVSVFGGSRMIVRTDDSVGRVLAISGVWEPNVATAFARSLSAGDVCLDLGAHIGFYTLLASRLVGSEGHVYAFEPSPVNYRALQANLALNSVLNVTAFDVAVGARAGEGVLNEGPGTNTGRATMRPALAERDTGRPQVSVNVRPVGDLVAPDDLARVRVVKIDVEGYELEVLDTLKQVFDRPGRLSVFLELTPGWTDRAASEDLQNLCTAYRFTPYVLRSGYSVDELFPSALTEPARLASIPARQCDILLRR